MQSGELYAFACGTVCVADRNSPEECHWCASPCKRHWLHDEPAAPPYVRAVTPRTSRRPGNAYICTGCWHYRRKSTTIRDIDGRIVDRRSAGDFTLLVTDSDVRAIDRANPGHCELLYETLLRPPTTFCLMVREGSPNLLECATVNDHDEVRANTVLRFTLGNATHEYTVYDLESTLRNPALDGNSPGVQSLLRTFGRPSHYAEEAGGKMKKGAQPRRQEESGAYLTRVVSAPKFPVLMSA